jgi:uncharacterized alkaline shock family protein YloU
MTQDGSDTPTDTMPTIGRTTDVSARTPSTSGIAGRTRIADSVVARIVGIAAREVPGVRDMVSAGAGGAFAGLAGRVTGQDQLDRGVAVEVGEVECIVDLNIIVDYGESIPQVADSLRRNISGRLRTMTGLEAREVNINVADIFFPEQEQRAAQGQEQQRQALR